MHSTIKLTISALLALTLAACGGSDDSSGNTGGNNGGGNNGGGNSGGSPLTVSVSAPSSINENSTAKVDLSISGGSGTASVTTSITPANSWTSTSQGVPTVKQITGGLEIKVGEARIRNPQYQIKVTVKKGGETLVETIPFDVINVSGNHKYEYAKAIRESIAGQRLFVGEMAIIEQLATIARMDGTQADTEASKGFIARHNSIERILELKAGVGNAYVFDADMEKYEENNPNWETSTGWARFDQYTRLETCADSAAYCFVTHLGAGAEMFDAFFESTNWSYATPATGHVEFDGRTKTYSVFYVDGVNGEFDELGNWSFNEDLSYLAAIIQAGHQAAVEYTAKLK